MKFLASIYSLFLSVLEFFYDSIYKVEGFYLLPSIIFSYKKEGNDYLNGRYLNNGFHGYFISVKFLKWGFSKGKMKKIKTK